MVTTCSKRLGPVSDAQFQRALDRFDLGTFVKAEPTSGGLFGQNVFVSSSKGEFVLRVGKPHSISWVQGGMRSDELDSYLDAGRPNPSPQGWIYADQDAPAAS